jgi:hypothetical protein
MSPTRLAAWLAAATVAAALVPSGAAAALPPIHHVFVVVLENEDADTSFGPGSPAPYLARTLPATGEFVPNASTTTPDVRPYDSVAPRQSLTERTGGEPDRHRCRTPPPGPDASPAERARARVALAAFAAGRDLHDVLHGETEP